jgi:Lon protease-like protein
MASGRYFKEGEVVTVQRFRVQGFRVYESKFINLEPLNLKTFEPLQEITTPYIPDLPRLPGTSMLYSGMDP